MASDAAASQANQPGYYPTEAKLATFRASPADLSAILVWVNISDQDSQAKVLSALGDPVDQSDVAGLELDDIKTCLGINAGKLLVSRAKRFYYACRRASGADAPASAAPPLPLVPLLGATPPTTVDRKIKLSQLVDSSLDADLVPVPQSTLAGLFADYERDRGALPHIDHEPTPDQLGAIRMLIQADSPPYVDFSLFGPHGRRMLQKLSLVSNQFDPVENSWRRVSLPGPPNFDAWWRSWLVYRCSLLLLKASKPEPLDLYAECLRDLSQMYGQQCWFLVYQADVRMRREEMDRMRMRAVLLADTTGATRPDPSTVWGTIFGDAARHKSFWDAEVRDKALLYLSNVRTRADVTHDGTSYPHVHGQAQQNPPAKRARWTKAPRQQQGQGHRVDAQFPPLPPPAQPPAQANGQTDKCLNWNRGACTAVGPCPTGRKHICLTCGGNHRKVDCDAAPAKAGGKGGKGGKGGRGGKGGKRK